MSKLQIISDGTPQNTHVFDKYGNEIKGIAKIDINIEGNKQATATLVFDRFSIDIMAEEIKDSINVELKGKEYSTEDVRNLIEEINKGVDRQEIEITFPPCDQGTPKTIEEYKKFSDSMVEVYQAEPTIFERIAAWWRVPR